MWKWPCFVIVLAVACSTGNDEHPPMLGDCANCGEAPVNGGGGSSGVPEGGGIPDRGNSNGGDVAVPDALDIVDVGVGFNDVFPP
jgi:hypothetical protein